MRMMKASVGAAINSAKVNVRARTYGSVESAQLTLRRMIDVTHGPPNQKVGIASSSAVTANTGPVGDSNRGANSPFVCYAKEMVNDYPHLPYVWMLSCKTRDQ